MPFVIFIIVIALLLLAAFLRNNKIKKDGITVQAVVSRIEKEESVDEDSAQNTTYHYYVSYTDQEGNQQEAMIVNTLNHSYDVGQHLTIKYLPEKKTQVIVIK